MTKKVPDNPSREDEKLLSEIMDNSADIIYIRGKKYKIRWLHNRGVRKMTSIMLNEKDESKVTTKCVAALLLDGYWKIKFFYPIVWRWMYYIKEYTEAELMPIISMIKKKVPLESYYLNIISLTEMRDTQMRMTREEVERIRVASLMGQRGQ